MMHCTMDDLLALQAGEASGWARSHAEACATCRGELDALYQRIAQLKALPTRRPARDRWPAVREAVVVAECKGERARRPRRPRRARRARRRRGLLRGEPGRPQGRDGGDDQPLTLHVR